MKIIHSTDRRRLAVRAGRINARLEQTTVARRLGVPVKTYQSWERGNANMPDDVFAQVCGMFYVNLNVLEPDPVACPVCGALFIPNPVSKATCSSRCTNRLQLERFKAKARGTFNPDRPETYYETTAERDARRKFRWQLIQQKAAEAGWKVED